MPSALSSWWRCQRCFPAGSPVAAETGFFFLHVRTYQMTAEPSVFPKRICNFLYLLTRVGKPPAGGNRGSAHGDAAIAACSCRCEGRKTYMNERKYIIGLHPRCVRPARKPAHYPDAASTPSPVCSFNPSVYLSASRAD